MSASFLFEEYQGSIKNTIAKGGTKLVNCTALEVPPQDFLKVSFNVAVLLNGAKGAVAIVVRNIRRKVIDWTSQVVKHMTDPLILKVLACREVVRLTA